MRLNGFTRFLVTLGAVVLLPIGAVGLATVVPASASFAAGLTLQVTAPVPPAENVYISDQGNSRVLKVTPAGVQTAVGSGLSSPAQVAVDAGGDVFVADMDNNRVVKVTPAGVQTTVLAGLNLPAGVAVDGRGDVYIADTDNSRVLEVTPSGTETTVISGIAATSLAVDTAGDLYMADQGGNKIIELTPSGTQSTIGTGLLGPYGVAVDGAGNVLIGDTGNRRVRRVSPSGTQTNVGSGFTTPDLVAEDAAGDVFVADFGASKVYEVTPSGTQVTVGSGLANPYSVAVGPVSATESSTRQPVTLAAYALPTGSQAPTGTVSYFCGSLLLGVATLATTAAGIDQAVLTTTALPAGDDTVTARYSGDQLYGGVVASAAVDVKKISSGITLQVTSPPAGAQVAYIADAGNNRVLEVSPSGTATSIGTGLKSPMGVATDPAGDVFIADTGNNRVVEFTASSTQSTVGSGLSLPEGVATDAAGDVFIADTGNNRVVEVAATGVQTTVASNLGDPTAVAADAAGDVFVAEADNNSVVEITPSGAQTTVSTQVGPAGTPQGVTTDAAGDVFIGYTSDDEVVEVSPSGTSTVVLSTGLSSPEGLAVGATGTVYLADTGNDRVVELARNGTETDIGSGLSAPADVALGPVPPVPATFGQAIELTVDAFPAGPGAPGGRVTFHLGTSVLGIASLSETPSGKDQATLTTTALPAGTDNITANYSGDGIFAASSASMEPMEVALALGPDTLNPATVGSAYTATLSAAGGTAPYVFTKVGGSLPHGVTLASSGSLSGDPSVAGTFHFTVKATDSAASPNTGTRHYTLVVSAAA
jgi:sugar lactone lactonase YvrE